MEKPQTKENPKPTKQSVPVKPFPWKNLSIILMAAVLLLLAVTAVPYIKSLFSPSADSIENTETDFYRLLTQVIDNRSGADGTAYVLDSDYYDEATVKSYVSVMCDTADIKPEHIDSVFDDIFIKIQKDNTAHLIVKNKIDLILSCENKEKANKLDYALMGTWNDEIVKLTKGFYISQNDSPFENMAYGSSNVKRSGCGPISLAMAINYVNEGQVVTIEQVVDWANQHNMYQENAGTRWSLIPNFPQRGNTVTKEVYAYNADRFSKLLEDGGVLVASMKPGHFTDSGHFVVITEIKDGMVTVIDPASIARSLIKWDAELIFAEANNVMWHISEKIKE